MISILYKFFGKYYRKFNILFSVFFLGNFKLPKKKYNNHEKIFLEIKSMKIDVLKEELDKKKLFPSFKKFKEELRKIIFNNKKLRNFLSIDVIHKVMFGLNRILFYKELKILKNDKRWNSHWKKIITEQPVGNPIPYFLYPKSSGNRIHDVYNLFKLTEIKGSNNINSTVIEFGAGYGNFCNLFFKLNKIENYIIYDLLEVNLIQYYYLKMLGFKVILNPKYMNKEKTIYLFNNINQLNNFIKNINLKKSIFISNWGLSETPIYLRKKFNKILKNSNQKFFAFQENFGNVNNLNYFNKLLKNEKISIECQKRANENHYYFFSSK